MKEDGLRMWRHCLLSGMAIWLATLVPASAFIAYVSNEKSNTVTVIDTSSWTVTKTIKVGQRPRGIEFTRDGKFVFVAVGDDDSIQVIDTAKHEIVDTLPSGPDPELFALDADGKILINTSETTNMAHFIDTATHQIVGNVLVDARPRFVEFKRDGSEVWISSEIGGTVSVIDPVKRVVTDKISFNIPGLRSEAIQPVGISMTKDGKTAFVAL